MYVDDSTKKRGLQPKVHHNYFSEAYDTNLHILFERKPEANSYPKRVRCKMTNQTIRKEIKKYRILHITQL